MVLLTALLLEIARDIMQPLLLSCNHHRIGEGSSLGVEDRVMQGVVGVTIEGGVVKLALIFQLVLIGLLALITECQAGSVI